MVQWLMQSVEEQVWWVLGEKQKILVLRQTHQWFVHYRVIHQFVLIHCNSGWLEVQCFLNEAIFPGFFFFLPL